MGAPPLKAEISDTYPNPSNAVMRAGMGKLHDYAVPLLGTTGNAVDARDALGIPLVQSKYAEYTTNADMTVVLPIDDTIPTISEGTQILSISITPRSALNRIRVTFQGHGATAVLDNWAAAIFEGGTAKVATRALSYTANAVTCATATREWVAGSTAARTITVRVGPGSAGTLRLNGAPSLRTFGGIAAATLLVEEIAP